MSHPFPILTWGRRYRSADLRGDIIAGLTVAVMLIPQGMAVAMLAGLPPIMGLYASVVPLLLYAILGSSRQLHVSYSAWALCSRLPWVSMAPLERPVVPEV